MNFGGLGAAYPGYLDAMKAEGAGRLAQNTADTSDVDMQGRQALGRALFQAAMPGASPMPGTPTGGPQPPPPQPPPPGQASMPVRPPMGAPAPPSGGGMPGQAGIPQPPQQQGGFQTPMPGQGSMPQGMNNGPPGGGQGMPQLDLQTVIGRIQQANPGIKPEVLMSALERAAPILSQQAKQDMMSMKLQMQQEMLAIRERDLDRKALEGAVRGTQGQQRLDNQGRAIDVRTDQGQQRLDNQGRAIDVRTDQGQQRLDQGGQRLSIAEQDLDRRIKADAARIAAQGGAGRTPAGVAVNQYVKEGTDSGTPRSAEDITRFMEAYTQATNRPSATQIRQENNNKRYDSVITTIDDALADIGKSYKGGVSVTGLVGRGLRVGEIAANIAGWSDQTLANSFLQKIEIIKTQIPGLLAGRTITSRDERARVDRIVAGLSAGDTRQITIDDLQYLQKTLKQLRPGDLPGRPATGPGAGTPRAASPAAPAARSTPPVDMLETGVTTTFSDGSRWTLDSSGQPKQVP